MINVETSDSGSDSEADEHTMGVPIRMNGSDTTDLEDEHPNLATDVLSYMNTLRKAGQLCDCVIRVSKTREHLAHRAVLAAVSPYFMTMFEHDSRHDALKCYKISNVQQDAFEILLDYAYTGRLSVKSKDMKSVYEAARQLKFDKIVSICADHMINSLTIHNCFAVREFFYHHQEYATQVDDFIHTYLADIKSTKAYLQLPNINIKVLGRTRDEAPEPRILAKLIANWLLQRTDLNEKQTTAAVDSMVLLQHESVLFLNNDNHLVDAGSVADVAKNDAVQDYVKACKKYTKTSSNTPVISEPVNGELSTSRCLVACDQIDQNTYCVILSLQGTVHNVGVRLQTVDIKPKSTSVSSGSSSEDEETVGLEGVTLSTPSSFVHLADMSVARCGVGLAALDGRIIAVGGNDRGECLDSVEVYNCTENSWSYLPPMSCPRGRFECAVMKGKMYACGGSDGKRELNTVECFDGECWSPQPDMLMTKSSAGVGVLDNKLYVIGGYNGQRAQTSCERFDPITQEWSRIASLNVGRSQAAVCSANGRLYAFGGTNSWNCFDTVEAYDPETDKWTYMTPMAQARRGAAVAVFRGKVHLVGGSNGSNSLTSVEIYDPVTDSWKSGPVMKSPRANAGLVVCAGRLYISGGYGGNQFLSSVELLEGDDDSQWCSYLKMDPVSGTSDSDPDH